MNGWLIIFAVTSTAGGVWGSSNQAPAAVFASFLFGSLFFLALGTKAVLQGGTIATGAAPPNPPTSLEIHTTATPQTGKFPKVRVWRTVH